MDTLSHALWGYAVLRWRGPRSARWGALTGAAPDLLYWIPSQIIQLAREGTDALPWRRRYDRGIWLRDGPPLPPELVEAYHRFYVHTHSLVMLAAVAVAWYAIRRRPPWLLLPWALHIVMDIVSHERYLTPFLYPLSEFKVEGYAWSRPPMLLANWGALLLVYGLLYWRYWRAGARRGPWPEDVTGV